MEKMLQNIYHKKQTELDDLDGNSENYLHNFERDSDEDGLYPQQDSEGMIVGVGNGNSNIT
jgi:hypothetical protein